MLSLVVASGGYSVFGLLIVLVTSLVDSGTLGLH